MDILEGAALALREAFIEVFQHASSPPFSSSALRLQGLSDGNDGVQWNAGIEGVLAESPAAWLGVNLEGKQYRDWPIARLIQRELEHPNLIALRADLWRPEEITVYWMRDAWVAGGSRIPVFEEHDIAPTPIALSDLSPEGWRQALEEAQGCLATSKGRRAKQWITTRDQRREIYVSPHLQFRRQLPRPATAATLRRAMQSAREQMQPLYRFAMKQSA